MHCATSVDAALATLSEVSCDALVSDLCMPGRDGFDLLSQLRSQPETSDLPIVILTGKDDHDLKRRALDAGATDLLRKPVDAEELVARLDSALRLKEYQDRIKSDNALLEQRVRERTAELERSRVELVWRLGRAGEFRDCDTGNHVMRVGCYAYELAETVGSDKQFSEGILLTAPLHDLGKIGIPDSILLKPGKLTAEEWSVMKTHTVIGADILQGRFTFPLVRALPGVVNPSMPCPFGESHLATMGANIARSHHERWDGDGYPDGRAAEEIPIEARIVSIADVYDALLSRRPYKKVFSHEDAVSTIQGGVGTQFDPQVPGAFEKSLDRLQEISAELADESTAPASQPEGQSARGEPGAA